MTNIDDQDYLAISTCDLADALPRSQFMHYRIHPLWSNMPRIVGRAYTVKCSPGDHLMVHKAIYDAQPGAVLVVEADDQYAVSGGNVCAIAQQNGIVGFIVDGVVRDIDEVSAIQFPIHALGTCPKPGAKNILTDDQPVVTVGGVKVVTGDVIVADNDGIAVIPQAQAAEALRTAQQRHAKDANQSLSQWRQTHYDNVQAIVQKLSK